MIYDFMKQLGEERRESLRVEAQAYKQQLRFYAEHKMHKIEIMQRAILKAELSPKYKAYAKTENDYLALNRFRLFVAHDILATESPLLKPRTITGPPRLPRIVAPPNSPVSTPRAPTLFPAVPVKEMKEAKEPKEAKEVKLPEVVPVLDVAKYMGKI
jgi:hypothetical protein